MAKLSSLTQNISYEFNNINYLKSALTHKSYSDNNNERLEFLGDTVLGFVVSTLLYDAPNKFTEGELTSCRAYLVCAEMLVKLANKFELANYLVIGKIEKNRINSITDSMLANTLEAIIGAIYLDGGIDSVRTVLAKWYEYELANITPEQVKDPKSQLQEYAQSQGYALPLYKLEHTTGKLHAQTFSVSCKLTTKYPTTIGVGPSKRKAEQVAAEKLLLLLKLK